MSATAPACAREALEMVRAGLGYLAAADAAQLPAAVQAECLRELERHDAMAAAARAFLLAAFTAGQGHAGDGDYSAVSWLIHRTGITRGAAVGHAAWSKRTAAHPRVLAALAGLSRRRREVLVLRFYVGLSEAEIASTLGISAGTVKSTAARGLAALARTLRDTR